MFGFVKNFFSNMGNMLKKPQTVVYPKEKIIIPEGSRGVLHLKLDLDSLEVICSGCGLCEENCPRKCIKLTKHIEENGKEILDEFLLNLNNCIFCGNCVEQCELGAIAMSYHHQLADEKQSELMLHKDFLIKPPGTIRDFWNK